jgi:hypothetical protein
MAEYIRSVEVAEEAGIAPATMRSLRRHGSAPAGEKSGRDVVYRRTEELEEWIRAKREKHARRHDSGP